MWTSVIKRNTFSDRHKKRHLREQTKVAGRLSQLFVRRSQKGAIQSTPINPSRTSSSKTLFKNGASKTFSILHLQVDIFQETSTTSAVPVTLRMLYVTSSQIRSGQTQLGQTRWMESNQNFFDFVIKADSLRNLKRLAVYFLR